MNPATDTLITDALKLPVQLRAFVAEKLLESLDAAAETDISPAWRAEIRRRSHEIETGTISLRPAGDVFNNAYAVLK
ncbi:MAG: addiction module protein [Kiritimatiellales bacterium]